MMDVQPGEDSHNQPQDQYSTMWSEQQIAKMSEVHNFSGPELDRLKTLHPATQNHKLLKVFRELRSQVFLRQPKQNFVCLVTSVCPKGGASYTARNLAAAIALDVSKSAVLVDCNFYSPSADALLSAEANLGLTDYLSVQEMGVEFILYASGIKRLRVVPIGRNVDGTTEKFLSSKMRGFLSELKSRYHDRYVIVDAPSAGEFSAETRILADLCDFVILVVPDAMVTDAQVRHAVDIIGEERIAGSVLNKL